MKNMIHIAAVLLVSALMLGTDAAAADATNPTIAFVADAGSAEGGNSRLADDREISIHVDLVGSGTLNGVHLGFDWDDGWDLKGFDLAKMPGQLVMSTPGAGGDELCFVCDDVEYDGGVRLGTFRFRTGHPGSSLRLVAPDGQEKPAILDAAPTIGETALTAEAKLVVGEAMTSDAGVTSIATPTRIYGARPSPMTGTGMISFSLARRGQVSLKVFDMRGRMVRTLVDDGLDAGMHQAAWDGRNDSRQRVAAGVYFLRLVTERETVSRKVSVMK